MTTLVKYMDCHFPGFKFAGIAAWPNGVIHVFENKAIGQRMLIEVFADNSWAVYTFHANGEGK